MNIVFKSLDEFTFAECHLFLIYLAPAVVGWESEGNEPLVLDVA